MTVDTTPPQVTFTAGPRDNGVTADSTPTFDFIADEPVSFDCRVTPQAFSSCSPPFELPPLPNGKSTFVVRATDAAGNGGIAQRSFWVDPSPPALSISDVTVAEGDAGTADATLTLSLSRVPNHPVYVNFATSGGTATAGA